VVDSLVDHLAQVALDQRRRLGPAQVVEFRHPQRADLEHVAKTLGGDQPDPRALVLQNGVGSDRGAVTDLFDGSPGYPALAKNLGEAVDDRLGVVLDARRDFFGVDGAVGPKQHDVREGAADVDTDPIGDPHGLFRGSGERHRIVPLDLRDGPPAACCRDLAAPAGRRGFIDRPGDEIDDHAVIRQGLLG
jgi:hypothetical protein